MTLTLDKLIYTCYYIWKGVSWYFCTVVYIYIEHLFWSGGYVYLFLPGVIILGLEFSMILKNLSYPFFDLSFSIERSYKFALRYLCLLLFIALFHFTFIFGFVDVSYIPLLLHLFSFYNTYSTMLPMFHFHISAEICRIIFVPASSILWVRQL